MAEIENLDILRETLKNLLKVRKYIPQNFAILFNLSVVYAYFDCYFAKKNPF